MDKAIQVKELYKVYSLYDNPQDRFKENFSIRKKKYHKDKYALKNINFEVNKGESVGIIGTNGSGKSTLLKIITGVLAETSGNVEVDGKVSALLELGAGFNPEYTGIENIYLNGRMMRYTREEMDEKIDGILEFADIGDYIYQPVKTYSSGMFARLAFAVAINVDPDILIVDEALSVGDIFFQNKCFRKFEELKKGGKTILFVSHDLESIKAMTNRVLWIEQGEQRMFGDKIQVCNEYAKSIIMKNNSLKTEANEDEKDYYSLDKFNMTEYPGILMNNQNLLNDKVRVISCHFEDIHGSVQYEIKSDNVYYVVVIFESDVDIEDCIVGYVLQNKKGVSIINSNTLITGEKKNFKVKKGSINRVEFRIKFPRLYSDEYIIDCAVAGGKSVMDNIMYTWCYGATKIMVHNNNTSLALLDVDTSIKLYECMKGK
jgi:teichoic acid transport system ATP-binding protein